jgi:hypothetical protein
MRREIAITRTLDELALRGLRLLFGEHPTPDETAAYWIVNDLAPVLRRLAHLPRRRAARHAHPALHAGARRRLAGGQPPSARGPAADRVRRRKRGSAAAS